MGLLDAFLSPPGPVLHGARFLMRMPRMGDFESWRSLREASRDFLTPWEPQWSADELTRRAFRLRLSRYRQEAQERSAFTFFLVEPGARGAVLGGVTVGQIRRGVSQSCTLGYWMGAPHAGRGLMREAVDRLKPFVFETEGLHRMEAACLPTNARSIRLLEHAGFRREGYLAKYLKIAGRWEDHHLYALLVEDWQAARPPTLARPSREAGPGIPAIALRRAPTAAATARRMAAR